jgi:major membrane immunogen (membrane-anchored lipoprotein)
MTRPSLFVACALGLAACGSSDGPSDPYAFVGTWDCGTTQLTFTNTTYNDGTRDFPIQYVARDGMNYTLRFANGAVMALAAVTETGLTRVSGNSGAQLNCRRAG